MLQAGKVLSINTQFKSEAANGSHKETFCIVVSIKTVTIGK